MRPLGGFIEIALKSDQQSVLSTNGPSHKFGIESIGYCKTSRLDR